MYRFPITTAKSITKAKATRTRLDVITGVIDQVNIAFPPGPQGLLHVAIYRSGALLWPPNDDDGYAFEDYTLAWNPLYRLGDEPLEFTAVTWNEDDTFSHLVVIRFNIVPVETYFPERQELGILQRVERAILGRGRGG
jgi:hypothetical protein